MKPFKKQSNIVRLVSSIPVYHDDESEYVNITQSDRDLQAKAVQDGYDFKDSEYDIAAGYNDKFCYVDTIAGETTHYFLITDGTITSLEVHYPFAADYRTGTMTIYDAVQELSGVPTLIIGSTVLDTTILIGE